MLGEGSVTMYNKRHTQSLGCRYRPYHKLKTEMFHTIAYTTDCRVQSNEKFKTDN